MTPTVEYLEERFDTFNRMCFDGALPRIPIKLSRARTFVGRLIYRPVRDWRGRVVRREDFVLRISTYFDLPEAEIEDTLIHEMIHYWIAWKGIKDTSSHGFCVSQLADGRTALTVAAQPSIARIRRAFRWSPTVRSQTWYHSRDPWFNRYPHCRSPKIFPVDPAVLQPHLDAAELLNFS